MHAIPVDHRLPLPKGWPNRIRSAVIHAVSLAHFSLTFARSVASNSINARIRLKAENSRLRQEIALLIEEARIKDSRMDRIPAQRGRTIRRSNAWRSSNSEQHAAGRCLRRLAASSSLRRQSRPGLTAWTRRDPTPSFKFVIP